MAIAVVQSKSAQANANSITVTFDSTATSGNILFLIQQSRANYDTPSGWTQAATFDFGGTTHEVWTKTSDGTETAVTVSKGGGGAKTVLHFIEASDMSETLDVSSSYDGTGGTGTTVALTSGNSADVTTTAADTLLLAFGNFQDDDFTGDSWSDSFTKYGNFEAIGGGGADFSAGAAYRIVSSTGTYATTLSTSAGAADERSGGIVAFEAVGATTHVLDSASVASGVIDSPATFSLISQATTAVVASGNLASGALGFLLDLGVSSLTGSADLASGTILQTIGVASDSAASGVITSGTLLQTLALDSSTAASGNLASGTVKTYFAMSDDHVASGVITSGTLLQTIGVASATAASADLASSTSVGLVQQLSSAAAASGVITSGTVLQTVGVTSDAVASADLASSVNFGLITQLSSTTASSASLVADALTIVGTGPLDLGVTSIESSAAIGSIFGLLSQISSTTAASADLSSGALGLHSDIGITSMIGRGDLIDSTLSRTETFSNIRRPHIEFLGKPHLRSQIFN
jgi:hypothetical protein